MIFLIYQIPQFLFLVFGSYLIKSQKRNAIARSVAFTLFVTFFLDLLVYTTCSADTYGLSAKTWTILVDLQLLLYYFVSILIYEHYLQRLKFQRLFFLKVIIPIFIILSIIVYTTEMYGTYTLTPRSLFYIDDTRFEIVNSLRIAVQLFLQIFAVVNYVLLFLDKTNSVYRRKYFFLLIIATALSSLKGIWDTFYYLSACLINSNLIQSLTFPFYFVSLVLFIIVSSKLNAFAGEGRKFLKEFLVYLVYSTIIISIFSFLISILLHFSNSQVINKELIVLLCGVGFLMTQFAQDIWNRLLNYINRTTSSLNLISLDAISSLFNNLDNTKELNKIKLVHLEYIKSLAETQGIEKSEALKQICEKIVSEMKPSVKTKSRTKNRIKYEILRMIVEEQAKESQILWELGFESRSNIPSDSKPLLPLTKNSEYKATSIISYKRLRREAFEYVVNRLVELERKALRITK